MNHSGFFFFKAPNSTEGMNKHCVCRQLSKEPNLIISLDTLILAACPEKTSVVVISLGESLKNDTTV